MLRQYIIGLLGVFLGVTLLSTAQATTLVPVDLTHLHKNSQTVVYAECIDNKVEIDSRMNNTVVTYTTFSIMQTIKGATNQTITIKQIGGKMPDNSMALTIPGVPEFKLNEKYVLFLPKASHLGFSSPVGLGQGSFRAYKGTSGNMMVTNGRDFSELMGSMKAKNMSPAARKIIDRIKKQKPLHVNQNTTLPLDDFILMLKNM